MIRVVFVLLMMAGIAVGPTEARAAEDEQGTMFGLSPMEFALGVATAVTALRIIAVLTIGSPLLGRNLGTGLLTLYLGHVVAEGAIYGAGAGAASYAVGSASANMDGSERPNILPDRLPSPPPDKSRLPLELAPEPDLP